MWRDILKGRSLLHKGLIVGIGNGKTTSLWYHRGVDPGPIYKYVEKDIPESKTHWFVCDIIKNGAFFG